VEKSSISLSQKPDSLGGWLCYGVDNWHRRWQLRRQFVNNKKPLDEVVISHRQTTGSELANERVLSVQKPI